MIMAGLVLVEDVPVDKPGGRFPMDASIRIKERPKYVSRGGQKLEAALSHFAVNVRGKVFIDVGASTGGFTDCLLQHGAAGVIAVDVGYGQLDWKLRQDPRVRVLEKANIRYIKPDSLEIAVHAGVVDVSFISLKMVVPPLSALLPRSSFIIALIKPQFEVGKGKVGKGGVVREPAKHLEVIENLKGFFTQKGWEVAGHIPSPILGPKGNREFLIHLTRG
jgi:23S rRNA (cytidine1920-2'-O)/16S rRNA (cytidine1409-2'-O)-methyltransferase